LEETLAAAAASEELPRKVVGLDEALLVAGQVFIYIYINIYVYIYRERERERERCMNVYIYMELARKG